MANPLALYVPIKPEFSEAAKAVVAAFPGKELTDGLNRVGIVHFALLSAIPDPKAPTKIIAVMLHTTFDGPMDPYLERFWEDEEGTRKAFQGLAVLALKPPKDVETLDGFINFIKDNNLAKDPARLYGAYTQTVKEIKKSA